MSTSKAETAVTTSTHNVTSIATATATSALTMPAEGTPERMRFTLEASDMTAVLSQAAVNPSAIVLWHGVPRVVADLVRAWRKEAQVAEHKRLADWHGAAK